MLDFDFERELLVVAAMAALVLGVRRSTIGFLPSEADYLC